MNFEQELKNKHFLISGVANKKSVAFFVAKGLLSCGAKVILSVQNRDIEEKVKNLFKDEVSTLICDVEKEEHIQSLSEEVKKFTPQLDGFLHSLAFAHFTPDQKFHETPRRDVIQAMTISAYSLVEMSNALKDCFTENSSVVTISISNTLATSYGYLGPIKALLEHYSSYLAKSFSTERRVRFNAVKSGPLKTSASSGIPKYLENYMYSELLTLRKQGLKTQEVANLVLFLLSPLSSGINGTTQLIDAGMAINYFDQDIVETVVQAKF